MTGEALLVLLLLQVKHFLFDFVWQTPWQLANKGHWGHPGGIVHSGLHVAGTAAVLAVAGPSFGLAFGLALAVLVGEFLVHYHLDWGKEQFVRRFVTGQGAGFWRMIGLDQLLHQLTYLAIVFVLLG